jgi:hypothetical protein
MYTFLDLNIHFFVYHIFVIYGIFNSFIWLNCGTLSEFIYINWMTRYFSDLISTHTFNMEINQWYADISMLNK